MGKQVTLSAFLNDNTPNHIEDKGGYLKLFLSISEATKWVNAEVNRAGLTDYVLGAVGKENVQGEDQQKLDLLANDIFIHAFQSYPEFCGVGSEEMDDFVSKGFNENGDYVVLMDPLDGSSNIDVNVSIGTIFSIYKRVSPKGSPCKLEDFLQPGNQQVVSGYVLYGTSTMLVYTDGQGVNGFTLDPQTGDFYLSHPDIKAPDAGKIYSINEGNMHSLSPIYQTYIQYCQSKENDMGKPYSARYIGSLVADFHRNLLKGGIYIYPETASAPQGKLRLLYEGNPLAWIAEQAGGLATNGSDRIMDIVPTELHQRAPLVIGSKNMVEKVKQLRENVPV